MLNTARWRLEPPNLRPPQRCGVEPSEKVKYLVYLVFGMLYRYKYVYIMYLCVTGWYIADIIEVTMLRNSLSYNNTNISLLVVMSSYSLEIYQFEDKTTNPVLRG